MSELKLKEKLRKNKEFNKNFMKLENNKCLTKSTDSLNKLKETETSSKEFSQNKRSKEKLSLKLKEKDNSCLNNMLKKSENRSSRMMRLLNKLKLNT